MSTLAPDRFQRRFQDLMDIGRARLRPLAPEWTDHNAHDPGITLMELLAWVAEAQLYSLSHLRRDERRAYAALLGLAPSGTEAARGLIWADPLDPRSPAATFVRSLAIPVEREINVLGSENPTFRPTENLLWAPGRIQKLETRLADGRTLDHTLLNERGGPAYLPFGTRAGRRDVLVMTFACRDKDGVFGDKPQEMKGSRWAIGVRAASPLGGAAADPGSPSSRPSTITATLVSDNKRFPLRVVSDSTEGMLTTGVILLDLDRVTTSPVKFSIELQAPRGFARPPRVMRIEPNVLPIVQGQTIERELAVANGMPDWSFELAVPGLRFRAGEDPVTVEVEEATGPDTWARHDRLSECGPDDRVYQLDTQKGRITFGNGVNGRIPPAESKACVTYAVSDGEAGRVARNRRWQVAEFEGAFGVNVDPVTGGAEPFGWPDQRREARRRAREQHALVSSGDIADAAKALPLLEVVRAWVAPPKDRTPRTGVVTLIVMRSRPDGKEPDEVPETARWLEAIRRRLANRMPLGARLVVSAPRYVAFSFQATLEIVSGRDPSAIRGEVEKALQRRLALVGSADGAVPREPGVPVSARDLVAWMRAVDGVSRVSELRLLGTDGRSGSRIDVGRRGLPKCSFTRSTIQVRRAAQGSAS